jgi:hypothetical protein
MKKIFLLAVFAVMSITVSAQSNTDGNTDGKYEHFINVFIDWGTVMSKQPAVPRVSVEDKKPDYIYDSNGEKMKFASRNGLMNYFTKKGWIFVQLSGNELLFKKYIKDESEVKKEFIFKEDL